jgi:hypothetical protein
LNLKSEKNSLEGPHNLIPPLVVDMANRASTRRGLSKKKKEGQNAATTGGVNDKARFLMQNVSTAKKKWGKEREKIPSWMSCKVVGKKQW